MERKFLKKLLVILIIFMLMATDFALLGTNLISYAVIDSSTNNANIEYSTYFKDEKGKRVDSIVKGLKEEGIKIYAEIKVKNEGYFNGAIEITNSNFNIKNNILSNYISSIEGNKVNLKQINAGETVEIELEIEPIKSDKIEADMLSKASTVRLTGEYMETAYKLLTTKAEGSKIEAEKQVTINFQPDESMHAELETDIITNKVLSVNGKEKRVVQLYLKSRLTNNDYPIKQTTLLIDVPDLGGQAPEEVKVMSLGTVATNGRTDTTIENWKNENKKVQITLENNADSNNQIAWAKGAYDEIVVTYIYAKDVDASVVEITANSEIQLHNSGSKFTAKYTKGIKNKELNNTIVSNINVGTNEIYKGQLYANTKTENVKEVIFNTTTKIGVRATGIANEIKINEQNANFVMADGNKVDGKTRYVNTIINKEKMLNLLGQDGFVEINGTKFNKDSETDNNGNIVLNYNPEKPTTEINIKTSEPKNLGTLEISHTRAIMGNTYSEEQLRNITGINLTNNVTTMLGEKEVSKNKVEATKELKETYSQAELTINKENLSTMAVNNEFIIGVKLNTADTKYDLYKNPKIKIQLPKEVEEISINGFNKLYGDEFEIKRSVYNKAEKTIEIDLKGEQLGYAESQATQLYLQININVKLKQTTPSKTDKITMEFTNENAVKYMNDRTDKGIIEKGIGISSPNGVVTINNIETSNIQGITGINEDKQLETLDINTAGGTDREFKIALINNTKANIKDVNILGRFPTEGEFTLKGEKITNTLGATLKGKISGANCTVYYSEKADATNNVKDTKNGWSKDINAVKNAKSYLIVIDEMLAETNFEASYVMTLPQSLKYDITSYTGYEVTYNGSETANSLLVGMTTGETVSIKAGISGTVGNDTLKAGDTVKNGEVIKYKAIVRNDGKQKLTNILVKSGVPEGTVYVEPEEDYVYTGPSYYKERPEVKEVSKTIESLEPGQEYIFEYEVRVKTDTTEGTTIKNKTIATYAEDTFESEELSNIVKKANLRVTIKRARDLRTEIVPNGIMEYQVFAENLSDEEITNVKMEIVVENQEVTQIDLIEETLTNVAKGSNTFTIDKIPAKGLVNYSVVTKVLNNSASQITAYAKITDSNKETYRSNFDTQRIDKTGAEIAVTSPTAGKEVNVGDEIEYKIVVKNIGTISTFLTVKDNFPSYVKLEKIYLNGKLVLQSVDMDSLENFAANISNNYHNVLGMEPGETQEITVIGRATDNGEDFELKQISNYAVAEIAGKEMAKSSEVKHTIKKVASEETKSVVSGLAWLDSNQNGQKDVGEELLSDITVKLFDVSTNNIAKNKDGNIAETKTDSNGEYIFTRMNEGEYIVIFEYDISKYETTTYMKEGVPETLNSKAIVKKININGEEKTCAVTDKIAVKENVYNINIGLKENLIFDLELDKYVTKVSVQNSKGTKSYDYSGQDKTFVQVQLPRKQVNGTLVVVEYTIRAKNTGKLAGTITNLIDYMPSGMTFSSELNSDWYLSGNNLYSKSLANTKIEPGETKEIKIILTKTMTGDNVGLVNNRSEIVEVYNEYGKTDIDSTPNNQATNEDDLGSADVMIAIATGARTVIYTILIIMNVALIGVAIYIVFIKNRIRK